MTMTVTVHGTLFRQVWAMQSFADLYSKSNALHGCSTLYYDVDYGDRLPGRGAGRPAQNKPLLPPYSGAGRGSATFGADYGANIIF